MTYKETVKLIKGNKPVSKWQVWAQLPRAWLHVKAMETMLGSEGRDKVMYRFRLKKTPSKALDMAIRLLCTHKFKVSVTEYKYKCVTCKHYYVTSNHREHQ